MRLKSGLTLNASGMVHAETGLVFPKPDRSAAGLRYWHLCFAMYASCILNLADTVAGSAAVVAPAAEASAVDSPVDRPNGKEIYAARCASCHGENGEGSPAVPQPLFGDRPTVDLADVISRTMPDGNPEECVGEDAGAVAEYMQQAFYSPEAQARLHPPRIELSRLTVSQYRNALADLSAGFRWFARPSTSRGLKAEYYSSRNNRRDRRVFEQIDRQVNFQFGAFSPDGEKISEEEFSVRWQGSLIVQESGSYEFILQTENAGRLYVNDPANPLIDAWVRSGSDTEFRGRRYLLAGRIYPIVLEWFKFKEATASVQLLWKPPHRQQECIPSRNLTPEPSPRLLIVETPFPPDDRSSGYERGNFVSREWDDATTNAAIEAADKMLELLPSLIRAGDDGRRRSRANRSDAENAQKPAEDDENEKIRILAAEFSERAFRRPLTDDQRTRYIDRQFESTADPKEALRRVILLTLKSPLFLYREPEQKNDAFDRASVLSFALLNSIPDKSLFEAAGSGKLETDKQLRDQAWRLMADPRAQSRLKEFLRSWMNLDHLHEIDKDKTAFPDFTADIASDMRTSLELLLDKVTTSENASLNELLTTDLTFLNGRLGQFYGVSISNEADFEEVRFEPDQRSGIISHPFLLSGFSYQRASSPIHRGVFVFRGVLGRALKPPPVAVAPAAPDLAPDLTTRERVHLQTSPEMCANCHRMINGLGFSLENFDAVGRYRETEQRKQVDAQGSYLTRTGELAQFSGAKELAEFLASSDETRRGVSRQLFHFMVQQPVMAYGPETLNELSQFLSQHQDNLKHLMVEIACRAATGQGTQTSEAENGASGVVEPLTESP